MIYVINYIMFVRLLKMATLDLIVAQIEAERALSVFLFTNSWRPLSICG